MTVPFALARAIKLKVAPRFPALLAGGIATTVVKANGNYTVNVDYTKQPQATILPTTPANVLVYDPLYGYYQVPLQLFANDASSGWQNRRVEINEPAGGGYTVANTDKWATLALTGGNLFSVAFTTPTNYDANFFVVVLNEDTTRGKRIVPTGWVGPSGKTSFILWPGQTCVVYRQNNVWHVYPSFQRWAAQSVKFYVDNAGSDTNDGLGQGATAAFNTIGHAVQTLYEQVDCINSPPAIYLAAGIWGESVTMQGQLTGYNVLMIIGTGSTQTTWRPHYDPPSGFNTPAALTVADNAECQLSGIFFDNVGGPDNCVALSIHQTGVVDIGTNDGVQRYDVVWGSFPGVNSAHVIGDQGGFISFPANYTIKGGAAYHIQMGPGAIIKQAGGGSITIDGTAVGHITIGTLYFLALQGTLQMSGPVAYNVIPGTATITNAYHVDFGTMIFLNGTTQLGPPAMGAGVGNGVHGAVVA